MEKVMELTTRCGWRRRELELRSFTLFFDMRSGDGDKRSSVALYAGDRYPSSKADLAGASGGAFQEEFSTHWQDETVSPLERNLGNARQWANSGAPRVGDGGSMS